MTQTTVRAPAPPPGAVPAPASAPGPASDPTRPRGRVSTALREGLSSTPGRLRVIAAVAVLACLAFAALGALAFSDRADALADARADAAQLVRVQEISISLVSADAAATNAFLATGPGTDPPAAQLRTYDEALSTASRRLADAARAEPADAAELALVNDDLTQYAARISRALQVRQSAATPTLATGVLGLASQTLLRESMLPRLDAVVKADSGRVEAAFLAADRAGTLLLASGVAVLLVLVVAAVRLARTTRRVLNLPLLAAVVAVAVALGAGLLGMASSQARAREVSGRDYTAARQLATARIAAFRAKADESITLIRYNFTLRQAGNGDLSFVDPGQKTISDARLALDRAQEAGYGGTASTALTTWAGVHERIIKAVAAGDTDGARSLATGAGAGTSNAAFAAVVSTTEQGLREKASGVGEGLASPRPLLLTLGIVALVLGVLAAAASWIGVSQRLEEYR